MVAAWGLEGRADGGEVLSGDRGSVVVSSLSHVRLFATPWAVVHQAPLSMGFSRQEYWSGLPFPPPGVLPTQGSSLRLLPGRLILYR